MIIMKQTQKPMSLFPASHFGVFTVGWMTRHPRVNPVACASVTRHK